MMMNDKLSHDNPNHSAIKSIFEKFEMLIKNLMNERKLKIKVKFNLNGNKSE